MKTVIHSSTNIHFIDRGQHTNIKPNPRSTGAKYTSWLPVRQRVLFKTAVFMFQCLAGQAPSYLSDDCQPVFQSRLRRLRSSYSLTCVVRRAHNTYGDRCFATAGPRVWNSLPIELQQCDSLGRFKRCLKTFLFGSWNYGAL